MNFLYRPGTFDISNITKSFLPTMSETFVDWEVNDPPHYVPFDFEMSMDPHMVRRWFWDNWTITLYVSIIYVLAIYVGLAWMKNRQPYNLRRPLAVWNILLALFSFIAFVRTAPELYDVVNRPNGFYKSVCVRDGLNVHSTFWAILFAFSKLVELGDTVFIILRKTPLIFLHWYHHMITLIVCWMCFPQAEPIYRYIGLMNLLVHSFMYSWYALKAMQFNLPRRLAMVITFLQLCQMAVGLILNCYTISIKNQGIECAHSDQNIRFQFIIYSSYFILFSNFFFKTYIGKPKSKKE